MAHALEFPPVSRPLLRPGETCWRIERADRVALLVDGAAYFSAAKAALLKARRSILLLGWDFDPRTRLSPDVDDPRGDDTVGALLLRLQKERDLDIRLLIWDMALPLAARHEFYPQRARGLFRQTGVRFVLDRGRSFGACQHQKVLVVDDQIAFCGSADFAPNRWDTPEHDDDNPHRKLPSGRPYPPRHELVLMVEGPAAKALADLARERWVEATGQRPVAFGDGRSPDYWPADVVPDLRDVPVAIARTLPPWRGQSGVRDNQRLYLEAIASARRLIYLENQYFTSSSIGAALAARLAEPEGPEIVLVCSRHSPGLTDALTMDRARDALIQHLRQADRFGRFNAYAPHTRGGNVVIVHSKLAVFDDRLLRVGSTNLNNRSMGYDTECDLAIEAPAGPAGEPVRRGIAAVTCGLIAHHLGRGPERLAEQMRAGGLAAAIEALDAAPHRRLRPLVAVSLGPIGSLLAERHLGDPFELSDAWRPWRRRSAVRR
ncbi:MAG TPA: phospholipase D-like domain-containing protein [Microvirga sp.]|nr:phospholipase D-like domain-containing protein [Microvirga sp.]